MASAHPITDHREIQRWAEARAARPACVKGTGRRGDTGMIRLDFPGFSGGESLQSISWEQWFRSFDDNDLALLVQDKTASGTRSNFNKLVARSTAEGAQQSRRGRRTNARSTRSRSSQSTSAHRSTTRSASPKATATVRESRHAAADRSSSKPSSKSSSRMRTKRTKMGHKPEKVGSGRARSRRH